MDFPKHVTEIAAKAARRYKDDIDKAVDEAEAKIRKLPDFGELVDSLVRAAVQRLVWNSRHTDVCGIKRAAGCYGGPAKVSVGSSAAIKAVYNSTYDMPIAGKTLGSVLGKELAGLAEMERSVGDGHYVNAKLVQSLVSLVPAEKRVRDAVKETRLRALLKQAQEKIQRDAA